MKENLRFVEAERASSIRRPAWKKCSVSIGRRAALAKVDAWLGEWAIAYRDDLFANPVPRDKTCRILAQLALSSPYRQLLTYSQCSGRHSGVAARTHTVALVNFSARVIGASFPGSFSRDVATFAGQLTHPLLLTVVIAVMSRRCQGSLAAGFDLVESQILSDISSRVLV